MNYIWILFFIRQWCLLHGLPRNTFPFLRLGMAPPAAPVAFCGKQGEIDLHQTVLTTNTDTFNDSCKSLFRFGGGRGSRWLSFC